MDIKLKNEPVLDVKDLLISYSDRIAVQNISFSVFAGEIFGLLGPNGAGKTSTLSAIEGLLKPQSGNIQIAGFDIFKSPLEARANLGVQLQTTSFQQNLNVFEIIKLYAGLYGVNMSEKQIKEIIQNIKLEDDAGKKSGQLSGGQQQRLALATAWNNKNNVSSRHESFDNQHAGYISRADHIWLWNYVCLDWNEIF